LDDVKFIIYSNIPMKRDNIRHIIYPNKYLSKKKLKKGRMTLIYSLHVKVLNPA